MTHLRWDPAIKFEDLVVEPDMGDRACRHCGAFTNIYENRDRRLYLLTGPKHLVSKLAHCVHKDCRGHREVVVSPEEMSIAPRERAPERLAEEYRDVDALELSIDGLQPEKGHETLYVVRELRRNRVWFAEPLLSATEDQVRRLITKAKQWAESLGTPVGLWMSDKQEAFARGIAAEFPDVPHRYCDNH